MFLFSQTSFPKLWLLFQNLVGGSIDKRQFAILKYKNQREVLEVGCSAGNIAEVFKKFKDIQYTGIDIDRSAIECAKKRFADLSNFNFVCQNLKELTKTEKRYDYILFANVCHHVDNLTMEEMLSAGVKLLSNTGSIVVLDLVLPEAVDSFLVRNGYKIDQGKFIRSHVEMKDLLNQLDKVALLSSEIQYLGATPFTIPKIARLGLYHLSLENQ